MCELGFTVSAKSVVVGLGSESKGIPESNGFEGTDQLLDDGDGCGNGGGSGFLSERRECGGGSGKGKDGGGGDEFHCRSFVFFCFMIRELGVEFGFVRTSWIDDKKDD